LHPSRAAVRSSRFVLAALVLALLALAALWRYGPLAQILTLEQLLHAGGFVASQPAGPLWVVAVFALVSLAGVPVVLLIVCTEVLLGPVLGAACALVGSVLSAALGFGIGRAFGPENVRRLAGDVVDAISRRLARRGILAVLVVRVVPVAPFTVINVVAGASHIRPRDFLVGTLLGMAPGIAGLALFSQQALHALAQPSGSKLLRLAAVIVLLAATLYAVRRWMRGTKLDEPAA